MVIQDQLGLGVKPIGVAPTGHVHPNGYIGPLTVVHDMRNGVRIEFGLPILQVTDETVLYPAQGADKGTCQGHIHRQCGIPYVPGFIKDETGQQFLVFRNFISRICGEVVFFKLGKSNFFTSAGRIVFRFAVNQIRIHIEMFVRKVELTAHNLGSIVALIASFHCTCPSQGPKIALFQTHVQGAPDHIAVPCPLLAAFHMDIGKVGHIHIGGNGIHFVGTGPKDPHAIYCDGQPFGGHVIEHGVPGIGPSFDHGNLFGRFQILVQCG